MVENLGEWHSKRRSLIKIRASDGRKGDDVPFAVEHQHDFYKFGCHLGNVGILQLAETIFRYVCKTPDQDLHLEELKSDC